MSIRQLAFGAMLVLGCAATTIAGRLYGTADLLYYHTDQSGQRVMFVLPPGEFEPETTLVNFSQIDDLRQQTLLLNYEDVLFYKNQLRLGANIYRRELPLSSRYELRPIYNADLRSYGYSLSSSYSPYKQLSLLQSGTVSSQTLDIYNREWRNTASINYPEYPTLGAVYNYTRTFDRGTERRQDAFSKNAVLESGYTLGPVSTRINYNRLEQDNRIGSRFNNLLNSYTGAVGLSQGFSRLGYLSTNYTYYSTETRRETIGSASEFNSRNHSVSGLFSSERYHGLNLSASYSGRFFNNEVQRVTLDSRSQTMSAQLSFNPLTYLGVDAVKAYQINNDRGENEITEYLALSTNFTRAIRQGVTTRLMYSRTMFQQSSQTLEGVGNDGRYTLDAYFASLGFQPLGYIRTLVDVSVQHNSEPSIPEQRYQVTYALNSRLAVSRAIEGRLSITALYQGTELQFGRTYSQNYNTGVSYSPRGNLNFNVTYTYTTMNAAEKVNTGSLTGFASYSFRRNFTLSFNASRQQQETEILQPLQQVETVKLGPYTLNGQLLVFLSTRTTLNLGYLYSKATNRSKLETINKTALVQLNIQI